MKPPMLQTAYILGQTRNKYGDYTDTTETAVTCKFRVINTLQHNGIADSIESDAMAWFEPDSGVVRGTIIKYDGTHYKVERLTEARRLHSTSVQFIKTELIKYGPIS